MSKIMNIKNEDLQTAVKKCAVSEKDTYELKVTAKKDDNSGKYLAQLVTCNGNVQISAFLLVQTDGRKLGEGVTLIFPASIFSGAVSTMAGFSDADFVFEIPDEGGNVQLSCGTAELSIPLLSEAVHIDPANPRKDKFAQVKLSVEELRKAVEIGSVAVSSAPGKVAEAANAIDFASVTGQDGAKYIRIFSVDTFGAMAASSLVPVKAEKGLEDLTGKKSYVLNSVFCRIVSSLKEGDVEMMLFDRQVMIRIQNDFYILVPNAAPFPSGIVQKLSETMEPAYKVSVNCRKFMSAIDIALLGKTSVDDNKVKLKIADSKLVVSSRHDENHADVETADAVGDVTIGADGYLLKKAVQKLGADVSFYGIGPASLIYFKSQAVNASVFVCPCALEGSTSSEKEESKKE